jgi:acetyl esterase/lipase
MMVLLMCKKLRQAGNVVQHEHYPDIHGFISMPNICGSTEQAMSEIVKFVTVKN